MTKIKLICERCNVKIQTIRYCKNVRKRNYKNYKKFTL